MIRTLTLSLRTFSQMSKTRITPITTMTSGLRQLEVALFNYVASQTTPQCNCSPEHFDGLSARDFSHAIPHCSFHPQLPLLQRQILRRSSHHHLVVAGD